MIEVPRNPDIPAVGSAVSFAQSILKPTEVISLVRRYRLSVPPVFPHFRRVPVGQAEATARLAEETVIAVIIETAAAVAAADAIAAVPGVDVLFLGASDLMADVGTPGAKESPALWQAAEAVVAACKRHGKVPGMGHFSRQAVSLALLLGGRCVANIRTVVGPQCIGARKP